MKKLHKLLERQIKKHLPEDFGNLDPVMKAALESFFESVSQAYHDFDNDRLLIERAAELSSKELYEANQEMKLQNKRIQEQQAHLVNTSKMSELGKMAGGIAHEINTPLATIRMLSNMLKDLSQNPTLDKEQVAKFSDNIEQTVVRIAKIISGLRTFSRDGSRDPFLTSDLRRIIDETIILCGERFKNHSIAIKVEAPEHIDIKCRFIQISQVLLNLLNNAYDAVIDLPEKWIHIQVKDLGSYVQMSVTDSGAGICQDVQKRLFTPFFTTKQVGMGTGLGLSISASIITDHNGKIEIDNQCSNTRFVILLPKDPRPQIIKKSA